MQSEPREPQAPESYDSFWEPVVVDAPPPQAPTPPQHTDAYQEFVHVTEDALIGYSVARN
jgi:hypothetical protein